MAIDVGSAATDRGSTLGGGYTALTLDNPANDTGTLVSMEIWCSILNLSNVKAGTFSGTAPDFTPRDFETIGTVATGSKQVFSGLDCTVNTGDYIGFYCSAGSIDLDTSGGLGLYYLVGDQWGAGEQTYPLVGAYPISLYGTSVAPTVAPTVTTQDATNIQKTTATGNGNITDDGGAAITEHGVCWKAGSDPVNIAGSDGYTEEGAGLEGAFTSTITPLLGQTLYYYRAYATNSADTSYGAAQSFTTLRQPRHGFVNFQDPGVL